MGFYTSGQLFLEDYYTLAVVAQGGIGTPHLDGNTRLCTATADFALKETFGTDGAAGLADATSTLRHAASWSGTTRRRRTPCCGRGSSTGSRGPDPPRLVVVDPRRTMVARAADVHLPIRSRHEPRRC